MKNYLILSFLLLLAACRDHTPNDTKAPAAPAAAAPIDSLRERLTAYISGRQADIGIAIRGMESGDTLSIHGDRFYPLMSVAKFPQALLLLHLVDEGKISLSKPLHFSAADLEQRTGSSIRKDHPESAFDLSIPEVLRYAIGQSDNITANKIFEVEGGPAAVASYVHSNGIQDVKILTDYAHMAPDSMHQNWGTPLAMVQLLTLFHQRRLLSDSAHSLLWKAMVEGPSGPDRLKGQLPAGTVVAHKTGTSGTDSTGVTEATNDIGIVRLPDGRHFAIAVFVARSKEPAAKNAEIIAHICKEAWDYFRTGHQ